MNGHDRGFWFSLAVIAAVLASFLVALLGSTAAHSSFGHLWQALASREILYSIRLSLLTCTVAAFLSVLFAVPIGYLLSRRRFPARSLLDALFDIPIVLPPMVMGLCLLVFFQTGAGQFVEQWVRFTYQIAGVVLAQFVIAAAFAIRIMKQTFDHLPPRPEDVAMTLGCTRWQAFRSVALPSARRGMVAAFCVAWARSLGEFGPILVFAGATRMKTEVLPTTVWLELSVGNLEAAVAVSLLLVVLALAVLLVIRFVGEAGQDGARLAVGVMIAVEDIGWSAGDFRLAGISFTVPSGRYGVLMGRTGSGKTSLIELICGLRQPATGRIIIGDRDVTREPPGRRRAGYVPQDGALFPTMTVREQIGFAPRRQGVAKAERESLVQELAEATGVAPLLDRMPKGLSGGERQRIALARALAARPAVLLLDEPLAALDDETHAEMMALLKETQRRHELTVLHVTHHRHEAETLADVLLRLDAEGGISSFDAP